jgi:hypothetical protein
VPKTQPVALQAGVPKTQPVALQAAVPKTQQPVARLPEAIRTKLVPRAAAQQPVERRAKGLQRAALQWAALQRAALKTLQRVALQRAGTRAKSLRVAPPTSRMTPNTAVLAGTSVIYSRLTRSVSRHNAKSTTAQSGTWI